MKEKLITLVLCFSIILPGFAQIPGGPAARSGYAMAYDANRGTVVLYGGQDTASARLGDTWEWAGGAWRQLNIPGPSARMNAAMAYDAAKKLIYLFGGRAETGSVNDLWTYDGKSWSKINTSSAPPPRQLGTMAFDKQQSQFVLFGGMDAKRNTLGDTWILKNNEWTAVTTKGPSPRASQCMTYNDNLGVVVMYGGYINDAASKEFWKFKDGAWQAIENPDGPPRLHSAIAYNTEKESMLMFGGFNDEVRTNELWEYANNKWTMIAQDKNKMPDPRAEHRCVFIPGKGLFVFGGVIGPDANTRVRGNDTWLYNGSAWEKLN
jgi:hypothetical protein